MLNDNRKWNDKPLNVSWLPAEDIFVNYLETRIKICPKRSDQKWNEKKIRTTVCRAKKGRQRSDRKIRRHFSAFKTQIGPM